MKEHTRHIAKMIRQYVNEIDPKAKVVLYGSHARGDERSDSDWDVLVLTDYPVDQEIESKFRNILYDLELLKGEPISVFVYAEEEWQTRQKITPFYANVTQEGIEL